MYKERYVLGRQDRFCNAPSIIQSDSESEISGSSIIVERDREGMSKSRQKIG
ncbi:predicted protein [Botrytis cinerea T4]|uniref:Uncharacterized protein n=1 Tax=Botryotinia fuckeliana (strain T4) TaxID=999810 RepID=G2YC47_BOTF4|nr:predicted protein [Botrytis cinerea T4]